MQPIIKFDMPDLEKTSIRYTPTWVSTVNLSRYQAASVKSSSIICIWT